MLDTSRVMKKLFYLLPLLFLCSCSFFDNSYTYCLSNASYYDLTICSTNTDDVYELKSLKSKWVTVSTPTSFYTTSNYPVTCYKNNEFFKFANCAQYKLIITNKTDKQISLTAYTNTSRYEINVLPNSVSSEYLFDAIPEIKSDYDFYSKTDNTTLYILYI